MDPYKTLVPVRIARLIYGFVNKSLSPDEKQEAMVMPNHIYIFIKFISTSQVSILLEKLKVQFIKT